MSTLSSASFCKDLATLTKLKLNIFVLVTTLFGFILATKNSGVENPWLNLNWLNLLHTILGTGAAAFGAAVFNQLVEIEQDKLMTRTADRPLPTNRISVVLAFTIGWILSAFGVIHLGNMLNATTAYLAASTIAIYVFVYTPMKRQTSANTFVGAIPGAIPPVIGWTAAGGHWLSLEAWILFAFLFLWQLPHFVAINWLHREEYEKAGYVMWSDGDTTGKKSGKIALFYSSLLVLLSILSCTPFINATHWWFAISGSVISAVMCFFSWEFIKTGERTVARKLFFYTLIYLPLILGMLLFSWR